jgi:transmembrane sensor
MHHAPSGEEIRECAADWILKERMQEWCEQDQRELDSWLAQSTAHLLAYLRLRAAWKQTDRLAALRGSMEPPKRASSRSLLIRVAGALSIAVVVGAAGANYFLRTPQRIVSTGLGEHRRIALADGSVVELNTDTSIHFAENGPARIVYLDRGEAYFQIKHNAANPFAVIAGQHRVIDIGTAFVVRHEAQETHVALVEGRARFDTPKDSAFKAIELKPGDEVVATASGIARVQRPVTALVDDLGWRRGVLIFYATTLADAARAFNRYNETKLVVIDPAVARLKINGTFQATNVQAFGDATQAVLGLKLATRGHEIVISR